MPQWRNVTNNDMSLLSHVTPKTGVVLACACLIGCAGSPTLEASERSASLETTAVFDSTARMTSVSTGGRVFDAPIAAAVMEADTLADSVVLTPRGVPQKEKLGARRGDWELTLSGVGGNDEDFDAGGGQLAVGVGYFFTEALELSVRQNLSFSDPGPGIRDAWNGVSRIAVDVQPFRSVVSPYIGAHFGWIYGDTVNESLEAGPEAGLKVYVNEGAFVQAAVEYQFFFDDQDSLSDAFEKGQFIYVLGLGAKF